MCVCVFLSVSFFSSLSLLLYWVATYSCNEKSTMVHYLGYLTYSDFCDCVDGSDEPGTSACPNGKFFCLNIGYESCTLPSSRVNDGICDCCDGSDEAESICPNTCQELGRERQQKVAEEIEMNRQGAKAKEQLVRSNVEQLNVLREKRTTLEEKKERLRVVVEQLETAIEERREDQVGTVEENNDGEASESSEDDEVDNDDELQDRLEAESIEQEEEDAFAEFDEEMELYDDSDYEREDFDALYPDDEEFHVKESAVHKSRFWLACVDGYACVCYVAPSVYEKGTADFVMGHAFCLLIIFS